jgi:hypothetical protein
LSLSLLSITVTHRLSLGLTFLTTAQSVTSANTYGASTEQQKYRFHGISPSLA